MINGFTNAIEISVHGRAKFRDQLESENLNLKNHELNSLTNHLWEENIRSSKGDGFITEKEFEDAKEKLNLNISWEDLADKEGLLEARKELISSNGKVINLDTDTLNDLKSIEEIDKNSDLEKELSVSSNIAARIKYNDDVFVFKAERLNGQKHYLVAVKSSHNKYQTISFNSKSTDYPYVNLKAGDLGKADTNFNVERVHQTGHENCVALAVIGKMMNDGKQIPIQYEANKNSYKVFFPGLKQENKNYIEISKADIKNYSIYDKDTSILVTAIEKYFNDEHGKSITIGVHDPTDGPRLSELLLGKAIKYNYAPNDTDKNKFHELARDKKIVYFTVEPNNPIAIAEPWRLFGSDPMTQRLRPKHAYMLLDYNEVKDRYLIANPADSNDTFEVSRENLTSILRNSLTHK